jgi:hypothetical protein
MTTANEGGPRTPATLNGSPARNGAATNGAKTGVKNGSGEPAAVRNGGVELDLSGSKEKMQESLAKMLLGPTAVGGNGQDTGKIANEPIANSQGETEETEETTEGTEGTEGTETTEATEGTEEAEETEPQGDWPQTAIAEVAKLRAARRELKGELAPLTEALTEKTAEIERLQTELEAAQSGRPAQATAEVPLAFARNEAELGQYAAQLQANKRAIEDYLDGVADPRTAATLENYAKQNGAWDAETDKPSVAMLKRWKRDAEDSLTQQVPIRAEQLKQKATMDAHAEQTFDFLKKKSSQEYKDFMEAFQKVPGLSSLPSAKVGAAVFALGMKEYRRMLAEAKGAKGTEGTKGTQVPKKDGAKLAVSKLPGRTVRLPQQTTSREGNLAALREKAFKTGRTTADVQAYTRAVLGGGK